MTTAKATNCVCHVLSRRAWRIHNQNISVASITHAILRANSIRMF